MAKYMVKDLSKIIYKKVLRLKSAAGCSPLLGSHESRQNELQASQIVELAEEEGVEEVSIDKKGNVFALSNSAFSICGKLEEEELKRLKNEAFWNAEEREIVAEAHNGEIFIRKRIRSPLEFLIGKKIVSPELAAFLSIALETSCSISVISQGPLVETLLSAFVELTYKDEEILALCPINPTNHYKCIILEKGRGINEELLKEVRTVVAKKRSNGIASALRIEGKRVILGIEGTSLDEFVLSLGKISKRFIPNIDYALELSEKGTLLLEFNWLSKGEAYEGEEIEGDIVKVKKIEKLQSTKAIHRLALQRALSAIDAANEMKRREKLISSWKSSPWKFINDILF
ncbi:MAG: hypothetical protein QXL16_02950 [Candidatus Micrarchaeaceae archaeon]